VPGADAALTGVAGRLFALRSNGRYSRAIELQLLLPAVLLALVYIGGGVDVSAFSYSLADEARASQAIVVIGPFVALSAAFEMRVLRVLWGRLEVRRPWYAVAIGRLWLVLAAGLVAMSVAYVAVAGPHALVAPRGWAYPLLSVAGVLAWTSVGAALGLVFRPVAAAPLALIVPYIALVFPGAWDPLWLRHLNGLLFDCCSTSEVLHSRALVASLAMLAACTVGAWTVVAIRLGPSKPSLVLLTAGMTLALGLALLGLAQARKLGPAPTSVRPNAELRCAGAVCMWPEDEEARRANALAWVRVQRAWASLGLPLREAIVGPVSSAAMLNLVVLTPDARFAAQSMSAALPRAVADCRERYDNEQVNRASDGLVYLIQRHMGFSGTDTLRLPSSSLPAPADAPTLFAALNAC